MAVVRRGRLARNRLYLAGLSPAAFLLALFFVGPALWALGSSFTNRALVGIDAANLDDMTPAAAGERPAHSILLAAGIPIVEHLTGLADLSPTGARFTAAPPRIVGFGTFPVRAYAMVPLDEPHDHRRSAGWLPTTAAE